MLGFCLRSLFPISFLNRGTSESSLGAPAQTSLLIFFLHWQHVCQHTRPLGWRHNWALVGLCIFMGPWGETRKYLQGWLMYPFPLILGWMCQWGQAAGLLGLNSEPVNEVGLVPGGLSSSSGIPCNSVLLVLLLWVNITRGTWEHDPVWQEKKKKWQIFSYHPSWISFLWNLSQNDFLSLLELYVKNLCNLAVLHSEGVKWWEKYAWPWS